MKNALSEIDAITVSQQLIWPWSCTLRMGQSVDPPPVPGILHQQKLQVLANDFAVTDQVKELT